MDNDVLTTSQAARLLSISVRTAQLLVEGGSLTSWKTPGGHRRVGHKHRPVLEQLAGVRRAQWPRLAAVRRPGARAGQDDKGGRQGEGGSRGVHENPIAGFAWKRNGNML